MKIQPAKTFKDLIVWQKAHALVLDTYSVTRLFPKEEIYVLTSQMRRAAISVAGNIAEAFKKKSSLDKVRILNIAQGSLSESEYHQILAHDLGYADTSDLRLKAEEVSKLLEGYIKAISK
jgi:four helix bundle protein